jgi:hypothetical protein
MKNDFKRWLLMNKVMIVIILLLCLFAWMDARQLAVMKSIDVAWGRGDLLWPLFYVQLSAVVLLWHGVLLAIAIIWYMITKDKSESLALFATPAILLWFGIEDLLYFAFSSDILSGVAGCWADRLIPVRIISNLLGETCPSALAMVLSALIGLFIAFIVYDKLQRVKKW